MTGQKTVPNVFIKAKHIGGCTDTKNFHKEGQLMDKVKNHEFDYDLIVLGGGSGGLACSKAAARLGRKVAVCDFVQPTPLGTTWGLGGTCVNVGCIPKKLMHQAALLGKSIEDAEHYGWEDPDKKEGSSKGRMNWDKLKQGVQDHIGSINWGYRVQLREKKVEYINGYAKFMDAHTIETTNKRGKKHTLTAEKFVIACGERPKYPNIEGAKEYGITSDDLFSLDYNPGKTLVVGASYVALECAGFLTGIGNDVTIMVRSILLRGFDQQIAEKIGDYMKAEGTKFIRPCTPTRIECVTKASDTQPGLYKVYAQQGDQEVCDTYNTILFAIGRTSTTNTIGLENVPGGIVPIKGSGKIQTNKEDQTVVPHIYCIGDNALGKPELTPVAIAAGRLLAERLYGDKTTLCDYEGVPTTVFTPLEYSCCGLAEEDAIEKFGLDHIEVFHSNFGPLEWTVAHHDPNTCYMKVICVKADNMRVVGMHYLGPNAGEVMQGYATAMKAGITKKHLEQTIGIHPTNAEVFTTLFITKSSGKAIDQAGC